MPVRTDRPFIVHAAALRRSAGLTRHEQRRGVIEGLGSVSVVVPEGAEVDAVVTFSSYPGGIMATGTISAPWQGECRRCGEQVTGEVDAAIRERYRIAGHPDEPVEPDDDSYLLTDDILDLEPLAREAVLLELPLAPLCADNCRGLCQQCGTNLNDGPCACLPPLDARWSGLDALDDRGVDRLA
jgi:uncharacterized protein